LSTAEHRPPRRASPASTTNYTTRPTFGFSGFSRWTALARNHPRAPLGTTILIKGHCFNNYFRTGAQRPSKRDTASPPVVATTYYDAVRLETETETLNGVTTTLTPRHNHLHLSYTDFADPFP
jgi:hypothetical protein